MPNTPSPDFWEQWVDEGYFLYTGDRLLNDELEFDFGSMTNMEIIDTYDLCKEDDLPVPIDLQVEMNTRGFICS